MAADLASLPVSQYDWVDALFMGLPNWTRWAAKTGNAAYLNKMDALFNWTKNDGGTSRRCAAKPAPSAALFDATEGLWYRDCTFVGVNDAHGKKIFWARGNGWVIAAMAQVIQSLPAGSPHAAKYVDMFKTMAAELITLQGSDGMWRTSLEDPTLYPTPETSGTSLITYALAYGVKAGLLPSATYLPAVAKAWHGLTTISLAAQRIPHQLPGRRLRTRPVLHRQDAANRAHHHLGRHRQLQRAALLRRSLRPRRQRDRSADRVLTAALLAGH